MYGVRNSVIEKFNTSWVLHFRNELKIRSFTKWYLKLPPWKVRVALQFPYWQCLNLSFHWATRYYLIVWPFGRVISFVNVVNCTEHFLNNSHSLNPVIQCSLSYSFAILRLCIGLTEDSCFCYLYNLYHWTILQGNLCGKARTCRLISCNF